MTSTTALQALQQAIEVPRTSGVALGNWRWVVRQRLGALRDELSTEAPIGHDGWLSARGGTLLRERNQLLTRLGVLAPAVLENPEVEAVREEILRIVVDLKHHYQRMHDLAYDEVEIELGGSE